MELSPKQARVLVLPGRLFLALIFLLSGFSKIPNWDATLEYMRAFGLPLPAALLFPAIFIEVLGGLSILIGFKARLGALALVTYLIPVSIIFHAFWAADGIERQVQMIHFLKNVAIMGGLFGIAARGAGAFSWDARKERDIEGSGQGTGRDRIRLVS